MIDPTPLARTPARAWTMAQLDELLDLRSRGGARASESTLEMQVKWINVETEIEHPGGSTSQGLACVWMLGMSAVHVFWKGYMHPRSRCTVSLRTAGGGFEQVLTSVLSCSHVTGLVHEATLSIEREQPHGRAFDLRKFAPTEEIRHRISATLNELQPLGGVAVFAGVDGSTSMLVQSVLARTGMTVQLVGSADQMIERMDHGPPPDLCIVDEFQGANESGSDLVARIRERTLGLPLILTTLDGTLESIRALATTPYLRILEKPFDRFELTNMVREILDQSRTERTQGLLSNSLRSDPEIIPILNRFVDSVPAIVTKLEDGCLRGPISAIACELRRAAEDSTMVGYYILGEMVKQAWAQAESAQDVAGARAIAEPVIGILKRLRAA